MVQKKYAEQFVNIALALVLAVLSAWLTAHIMAQHYSARFWSDAERMGGTFKMFMRTVEKHAENNSEVK